LSLGNSNAQSACSSSFFFAFFSFEALTFGAIFSILTLFSSSV